MDENKPLNPPEPVSDTDDMTRALPLTDGLAVSAVLAKAPEAAPAPAPVPDTPPAPTQVEPLARKKTRWYHRLGRVGLFLLKWAVALALIAAILAGGLVGYLTLSEYRPAHAEAALTGVTQPRETYKGQPLRIVTFNTGYAGLGREADFILDGGTQVNPPDEDTIVKNMLGIEDILRGTDGDILLLQEVDVASDRSFDRNQWQQYAYDLKGYEGRFAPNYVCKYVPYPLKEPIGKVHSGVATYSRYDMGSATRYSLPVPFSWPSRVAQLKRCLLVSRIPIEGAQRDLVIINLHLEAYDDGTGKEAQTRQLLELMEAEYARGNYVIAGGDFNQMFPGARNAVKDTSQWVPGLLEPLAGAWDYAYDSSTGTCRLLNQPHDPSSPLTQYYVIDGFIVSPNVQINEIRTLDEGFVYSDHNPVILEAELLP